MQHTPGTVPRLARLLFAFTFAGLLLASCDIFTDLRPPGQPAGRSVDLALVADGLVHPVYLADPMDGSGRLFVVDQVGVIRVLGADGTLRAQPFLDIRNRVVDLRPSYDERGLLGLAFHPNYATNGRFFVYYSAPLRAGGPAGYNHTSVISEFRVSGNDANRADAGSERVLLTVDQPQSNHNGGTILFGPTDGYLYISIGDGGGRDDEGLGHVEDWYADNAGGNGQDITQNLLGNILRIDVDGVSTGGSYGIPSDNPFVGTEGLDEIWAYGFRNPYRMSFDMGGSNWLYVGDAGQERYEEVSIARRGGNYGWNVKEGAHCFDAENPENPPASCPSVVGAGHPRSGDPLIDPVIELRNAKIGGPGLVVVGGHVYRGSQVPQLSGKYIFGVASRGEVERGGSEVHLPGRLLISQPGAMGGTWGYDNLRIANDVSGSLQEFLLGFGQDRQGEIYVLTAEHLGPSGQTGKVYRIAAPGQGRGRGNN